MYHKIACACNHMLYVMKARAFGKLLPWTAMVPFADCLNHNNVQTKYDFNVNNNGLFRLYPSGHNRFVEWGLIICVICAICISVRCLSTLYIYVYLSMFVF